MVMKKQADKIKEALGVQEVDGEKYEVADISFDKQVEDNIKTIGINGTLGNRDWRIDNLYKIKNKDGEVVTFKRNRVQKHFDKNRHKRNVILKSRQHGLSTFKVIDALDRALFTPHSNNLIIAHTITDAQKLYSKIEFAWNNIPKFIKLMVYIKSQTASGMEIGLDRQQGVALKQQPGKVVSSIAVATSGMSGTYTSVHITELGYLDAKFPEKAVEVMTGTIPAVPTNGDCDVESTARGNYGEFYNLYMSAKSKEPQSNKEFKAFFYPWMWDDEELSKITQKQINYVTTGRGEQWDRFREYQHLHNLTEREITCYYYFWVSLGYKWDRIRSEYPTTPEEAFQANDEAIFSVEALNQYETKPYHKVGDWKYYSMPVLNRRYVIGVDPAEGVGKDNHAIAVLDITDLVPEVVATYKNNSITPTALAQEVLMVCRLYNSGMACIERNNSGHATIGQLALFYEPQRIYCEVRHDKARPEVTKRLGWATTHQTKYKMVYDFKEVVEDFNIKLNDEDLIEELRFFTKERIVNDMGVFTERIGAQRKQGSHADLAMACFIAYQCKDEAYKLTPNGLRGDKERKKQLEVRKSFR